MPARKPAAAQSSKKTSRRDPRVDAYIEAAPEFARPILRHLRAVVHAGCPDITETIKWSMPSFERRGILAGMAAFKSHCVFGLWKHELLLKDAPRERDAMGSFGCIRALGDLPSRARLVALVKKARALDEAGTVAPRTKTARTRPARLHPDFALALKRSARARRTFEALAPSHQREYREWIAEARREETRARRIATAIEWLAAGKRRNWKYERA
ncbi:MAG: YdeI/OmpD-associated family protein [Planctomycetes bacterium]|nr:YdeI/OmpD-associated family protein [Planctomycetota bacterium]